MKALFSVGADVPLSRVVNDHRRWIVPIVVVLAINVAVLVAAVLPLRQRVASGETRANASALALSAAQTEFKSAEATRDGQAQATRDLERFYNEVLPADASTARRVIGVKLNQLIRAHDVMFERTATVPEELNDSSLALLRASYALSGEWEDIRQLIHEIETGPDFVVIDNVVLSEGEVNAPLSLTLDISTYFRDPAGNVR